MKTAKKTILILSLFAIMIWPDFVRADIFDDPSEPEIIFYPPFENERNISQNDFEQRQISQYDKIKNPQAESTKMQTAGAAEIYFLDRLFNENYPLNGPNAGINYVNNELVAGNAVDSGRSLTLSLGDLFVLDRLFRGTTRWLDPHGTTLGDLFILDRLFGQSRIWSGTESYSFGDLFVLDRLFNNDGSGLLAKDKTSLGDLIILDMLFNN